MDVLTVSCEWKRLEKHDGNRNEQVLSEFQLGVGKTPWTFGQTIIVAHGPRNIIET